MTSREAPPDLVVLPGDAVRTLELGGLAVAEGQVLMADKHLSGSHLAWANLITRFGGNGLALKLVGESIREVFAGDIGAFLEESGSGTVFGGIRRLLAEQLERSSRLEQNVLRVLAIEREPVTIADLIADLGPRAGRGAVLDAVEALRRRSLVERAKPLGAVFVLQSVVLEYVTDLLVEEVSDEITYGRPVRLVRRPLIRAQAKDYVRHTQEFLIGAPVLQRLVREFGAHEAEQRLLALLEGWRHRLPAEQGYGPGNVVNLLRLLRGDLRGLDLGRLALRQAYLAGIEAQDASLVGANLSESVLAEAFNFPIRVVLSSDGAYLVAGTAAGEVWLWRLADRTPLLAIQGHTGPVYGLALSADGRLLASASQDGTVRLWEAPEGRLLTTLAEHAGGVWGVALSADGTLLASGAWDGTVRLWEALSGQLVATLLGHTGLVYDLALTPDARLLASGSVDGTVRLWEVPSGRLLANLRGHTSVVCSVALGADGQLLASGGLDGTIRLWEVRSRRLITMLQAHTGGVWGVALSADGKLLASCGEDGTVRMWDLRFAPSKHGMQFTEERSADFRAAAGTPPSGVRPLAALPAHTGPAYGVALSPDGKLLASGSVDGTVRLWEASGPHLLATLQGRVGLVLGVALSPNGRVVASGGLDGTVRLWEVSSGRFLATLQGHTSGVRSVALSSDGRLVASGSEDGTVRLSEALTGRLLATL
ncbi:MAG TPA: WD40 repeat domain-containing protein, partial [Chloroflexota bacterium]|nr:WD40 repeat domain-containing protein [Chloroflexota bacterium]